jgi:ligand-binding sensor domain-containing protein/two-component sensor histidine kinase
MKLSFNHNLLHKMAYFALIFVLPYNTQFLFAQNLSRISFLKTEDGLGFRVATSIIQDKKGLIWIGTAQGLERFDGKEFLRFNNQKSADIIFPGEIIKNAGIVPYMQNYFLIAADEKLYQLNLNDYTWKEIELPKDMEGEVSQIVSVNQNNVLILVNRVDKNLLLSYDNYKFKKIFECEKSSVYLNQITTDINENIWWSTPNKGVLELDSKGKLLNTFKPDSTYWYGEKIYSSPLFVTKKNEIFIFPKSRNEIWQYFPEESSIKTALNGIKTPVYHSLEDSRGFIWFATKTELLRCNLSGEKPIIFDYSGEIGKGLHFTQINHLYEDDSGILWVATNNGIIKIPLGQAFIENYLVNAYTEWGNEMRGIFQTNNNSIYAYCENGDPGLYQIFPDESRVEKIQHFNKKNHSFDLMINAKNFIYNKNDNQVYFLTNQLIKMDMNNYVTEIIDDFGEIADRFGKNPFIQLKDGTFLIGAKLSNLTLYDQNTRKKQAFSQEVQSQKGINVYCYFEDDEGLIWSGTSNGIYIFNSNGRVLKHIHTKSTPAISNDNVLCLFPDRQQNIWAGTFGGGVNYIQFYNIPNVNNIIKSSSLKSLSIEIINTSNGLCNDNVPGILQDDFGQLWFSTYEGLTLYNPFNKTFQCYNTTDGISHVEFNYTSTLKDNNGMLWFGGLNGINKINPQYITLDKKAPAMVLLSLTKYSTKSKNKQTVLLHNMDLSRTFEFSPYDSWFQFDWTLPEYLNNQKNSYFTKLDGIDEDWSYLGNNPYIRYNSLPHGRYVLHIRATDSKGNESIKNLSIPFIIQPIYYKTWWFYSIAFISAFGLVYVVFRYKLTKKLEMERIRTQIASDLHDELGSMLSGLAMQGELLQVSTVSKRKERLQAITDISRKVVDKMRDLVWSIDSRRDSFGSLVERMKEQAEDLFQSKEIKVIFEIGEISLTKEMPVNVRQQLFLIYNEAINNIVRHSDCNDVIVRIGNFDQHFELSIKDNGSGVNKTCHKSGLGISNMQMRATKIGARIEFIHDAGYCIYLTMKKL